MEKLLGYLGIDQYGHKFVIHKYPRKELSEKLGIKHVRKMYRDTKDGKACHVGYVIGGHWIEVHEVCKWRGTGR